MPKLSNDIITAAIEGLEARKVNIDAQISKLREMLNGNKNTTAEAQTAVKRTFSKEAVQRMREAQRRRWAKFRGDSVTGAKTPPTKKAKRKLTAAGRKAISEAAKKRWASEKAAA